MAESATRSADRALALLAEICERGKVNLVDSARACGLAPSTALRLLRTLESNGFVRRDEAGNYRPGGRMIQLGAQALNNDSLADIARPSMERLSRASGESVHLSVVGHGGKAVYIAIVEGRHPVRHHSWVGLTIPLEGTATGQALTGRVPAEGYCVVDSGVESDVTAIAVPIRWGGRTVAALSFLVPTYRLSDGDVDRLGRMLLAEQAHITGVAPAPDGAPTDPPDLPTLDLAR